DDGVWGELLNEFLGVDHNPDGTLKETGTIAEKADNDQVVLLAGNNLATVTDPALTNGFMRVNLDYDSDGDTPDALVFYFNGVRTGSHNEKGELRARAAANNSVPFRVQQRSASHTADLTQCTTSGNDVLSAVAADG